MCSQNVLSPGQALPACEATHSTCRNARLHAIEPAEASRPGQPSQALSGLAASPRPNQVAAQLRDRGRLVVGCCRGGNSKKVWRERLAGSDPHERIDREAKGDPSPPRAPPRLVLIRELGGTSSPGGSSPSASRMAASAAPVVVQEKLQVDLGRVAGAPVRREPVALPRRIAQPGGPSDFCFAAAQHRHLPGLHHVQECHDGVGPVRGRGRGG